MWSQGPGHACLSPGQKLTLETQPQGLSSAYLHGTPLPPHQIGGDKNISPTRHSNLSVQPVPPRQGLHQGSDQAKCPSLQCHQTKPYGNRFPATDVCSPLPGVAVGWGRPSNFVGGGEGHCPCTPGGQDQTCFLSHTVQPPSYSRPKVLPETKGFLRFRAG